LKDRIARDLLDVGLDEIKVSQIDIEKDHGLIDRALERLKQEENRCEAVERMHQIRDFEPLQVAKGMPTISLNRYKNKELFAYGQLMDKDVPLYHRVSGCRSIIGL